MQLAMLEPFCTVSGFLRSLRGSCRAGAAPAGAAFAPDGGRDGLRSSSLSSTGTACSCWSYLREIGRSRFFATSRILVSAVPCCSESSRLSIDSPSIPSTSTSVFVSSARNAAFEERRGADVALPELNQVLADEAVAAEHLDAVGADLLDLLGALH